MLCRTLKLCKSFWQMIMNGFTAHRGLIMVSEYELGAVAI